MLRARQKFGKFKIQSCLARSAFADVYRAYDTIEGVRVALKFPHADTSPDREAREKSRSEILREVRVTAKLNHPHILPIKSADTIDGRFVIVTPLGETTLAERMEKRLSFATVLEYTRQVLEAVAHAHRKRVVHCDIKPENFILFPGNVLKLADFGIARVATRTFAASGSGTVGYVAPEQALGKPSFRSDVFSLSLLIYQMATRRLPEWPFDWPPPGFDRLRRKAHPDFIALIRRAMTVDARKRFANAVAMRTAFERVRRRAERPAATGRRMRPHRASPSPQERWQAVRFREFKRLYGKALEAVHACSRCGGPLSERMTTCPWCGDRPRVFKGESRFPAVCGVCGRGMKLDWRYCPHTYGAAQGPLSDRSYPDRRYTTKCTNPTCRGPLMPFLKYCPWCRTKVRKKWPVPGSRDRCPRCGWGIVADFWRHCPWCGRRLAARYRVRR
jgi:serine/threonine-protein kinase